MALSLAQCGQLLPRLPAVSCLEDRGVFHAGVNGVRIGERRFEVPHALELPRMLRAVVPFVRAGVAFVHEFVALGLRAAVGAAQFLWSAAGRLPGLAAVVGALDDLAEPAAGLRRVNAIRVHRRAFEMVDFPAREMRSGHVPLFAFAVRGENESSFFCANQHTYFAHKSPVFICLSGEGQLAMCAAAAFNFLMSIFFICSMA